MKWKLILLTLHLIVLFISPIESEIIPNVFCVAESNDNNPSYLNIKWSFTNTEGFTENISSSRVVGSENYLSIFPQFNPSPSLINNSTSIISFSSNFTLIGKSAIDFDLDGNLDLIAFSDLSFWKISFDSINSVFKSPELIRTIVSADFDPNGNPIPEVPIRITDANLVDLNKDGYLDIIFKMSDSPTAIAYNLEHILALVQNSSSTSTNLFELSTTNNLSVQPFASPNGGKFIDFDFDGNGYPEIIWSVRGEPNGNDFYFMNSTADFSSPNTAPPNAYSPPIEIDFETISGSFTVDPISSFSINSVDLNDDSLVDLVATYRDGSDTTATLYVALAPSPFNSSIIPPDWEKLAIPLLGSQSINLIEPVFGNLDAGLFGADVVFAGDFDYNQPLYLAQHTGIGLNFSVSVIDSSITGKWRSIELIDVDGDSDLDIIATVSTSSASTYASIVFFENIADGSSLASDVFRGGQIFVDESTGLDEETRLFFFDFDQDGYLDILFPAYDSFGLDSSPGDWNLFQLRSLVGGSSSLPDTSFPSGTGSFETSHELATNVTWYIRSAGSLRAVSASLATSEDCCGNDEVNFEEECDDSSALCCDAASCTFLPATLECRAAFGVCDVAENCTGVSADCPVNTFRPDSFVCREPTDLCDAPDYCTGGSIFCPATDGVENSTVVCRAAAGPCDTAENCDGVTKVCPLDGFLTSSVLCRPAAGDCDVDDFCPGDSADCTADSVQPSSFVCRPSNGTCDLVESCDGSTIHCPVDGFVSSSIVCREAADVECDIEETCTGTSAACPEDLVSPNTTVCRISSGSCDFEELCDGAGLCPPDIDSCGVGEGCESDVCCVLNCGSKECGPSDCPSFECGSCSGGSDECIESTGFCTCGNGVLDTGEECDPMQSGDQSCCSSDCTIASTSVVCRPEVAGGCDIEETCDGINVGCPADVVESQGVVCRPVAGVCDAPESCTGSSPACPVDAVLAATTVCRLSSSPTCDAIDFCDGVSNSCAANVVQAEGTLCDDGDSCTSNDACNESGQCIGENICIECGNGVIEGTETCDDGNTEPGDGCSQVCRLEEGFICEVEGEACVVEATSPFENTPLIAGVGGTILGLLLLVIFAAKKITGESKSERKARLKAERKEEKKRAKAKRIAELEATAGYTQPAPGTGFQDEAEEEYYEEDGAEYSRQPAVMGKMTEQPTWDEGDITNYAGQIKKEDLKAAGLSRPTAPLPLPPGASPGGPTPKPGAPNPGAPSSVEQLAGKITESDLAAAGLARPKKSLPKPPGQ